MSEPTHRLFFALRPDAAVAREIECAAASIKASGHVRGRWVQSSKHHLTVHFLGSHAGRPTSLIERAHGAAQRVRIAPFEIELERVETFGARRQSPCVLRCSPHSERPLEMLRTTLGEALADAGLARWLEQRFTPHVTIAYVDATLDEPITIPAITWRVQNFALVESHGATAQHEVLDRWPLRVPGMP
ncbi:MAG TPA: RNA 2',3'-cyclic phosphodiesterase [Rudaea sp.]|nr:RNA 2',3'-cyclic phosphodiesterase [Rudaea sp.]